MKKLSNQEKHEQCMKEIKWTVIVFALGALWQIIFGFALNGKGTFLLGMPTWFTVSVGGNIIISIVGVILLVKKVFVDFEYDEEYEEEVAHK